ncbi:lipopolysaccharide biosynthesis protein [Paenibacillus soyae]|uniref:Oligosaccharide flippase family protein n=1 Tax=Paenibacillus soyae TaxID=2969249 RepID=A0A9X2MMS9_9BACL|nr:oligosaccharide flippase family protein [Paenibacillus soyae]MCR2802516.1 oligosaccharide flippase family protein [Paenibacillus soyae]
MRVKHSMINVATGIGSQLIITLLSFISRTVFIAILGVEYLGINGLFTNILGMLALAEAGIGTSIIYALYKPVAEGDHEKVKSLMRLYRNSFRIIAVVVLVLGLSLTPFLSWITGQTNVDNVTTIYLIFVVNSAVSYLFTYKISMLNVNQKTYINTITFSISSIISTCLKIGILYLTENFILYLLIEVFVTIATSLFLAAKVDRMYPFLKAKNVQKLDVETKSTIVRNIKAAILQHIGNYIVFGTDNIIIASFVSVIAVGIYSNYYMFINICRTFINQVFDNVLHSLGNLIAKESKDRVYEVFRTTMLFNFWIYALLGTVLYTILDHLILVWLGAEFLLSKAVLIIVLINFYVTGMRRSINMVKSTSGIFHEDRFAPIVEAAINLVISIALVKQFGIAGVFFGTLISTLSVPFWVSPYLVFKKVFKLPLLRYFKTYTLYACIGFAVVMLTDMICGILPESGLLPLLGKTTISLLVPNLILVTLFYRTPEYQYLYRIGLALLAKMMGKFGIRTKKAALES